MRLALILYWRKSYRQGVCVWGVCVFVEGGVWCGGVVGMRMRKRWEWWWLLGGREEEGGVVYI